MRGPTDKVATARRQTDDELDELKVQTPTPWMSKPSCRRPPYGLRPITAPFAAGASNRTVSMCRKPASSSHAEYSAAV